MTRLAPAPQLSRAAADALQVLRSLGGQARTREILPRLPHPTSLPFALSVLRTLERRGRVTQSTTLDGLELVWTIDGGGTR